VIDAAELYDEIASELNRGGAHARTAAQHFGDGEVPCASARAWALQGHLREAQEKLDAQSREHARRSQP
jgi:hypothetical protein